MTDDEARIVLLEDALQQAQNTVEFMHGCLTDKTYKYAYPEMTFSNLAEWGKLAPRPAMYCAHSRRQLDCPSCQTHVAYMDRKFEAIRVVEGRCDEE